MKIVMSILLALTSCATVPFAFAAESNDWPTWNGPNHDLTTSGGALFDDGTFGLERLWSKPLGSGYSALSVVGDRLVTGFSDGTSDWMVALDVESGRELWRYRMAEETYRGHDGSDDGPVATPTIHGDLVYGLTNRGRLFALRLDDGGEVWTRHLVEELGAREPLWGFNSSPTVIGGVLVMMTGGDDGHSISALDPATGELLWSAGDDAVYYQSPIMLHVGDEEQIFALTNEFILGLVPKTGEILWREEHKVDEGPYTGYLQPVPLGGGRVLLTAWPESVLVRIDKVGDAYRVSELWRTRAVTPAGLGAVPVPYNGHIYGFKRGFLGCVDATTGETVWRSRQPGGGNLVVVDGHMVILARSGEIVVAAATPEGYREETRAPALEEGFYTRPTFAGGRIFVRNLSDIAGLKIIDEAAPVAVDVPEETEEVELLGAVGAFVRRVEAADNKGQLIDEFMAAQEQFPIVEEDGLVHFVFRGEVPDLVLKGSMVNLDDELFMHRIEETDFYFRSVRLEPAALHTYAFAVFDENRLDPLNPRRPDIPGQEQSAFTTEGWRKPDHLRVPEGDHRGRIETFTWKSDLLDNEREIQVYLPPGYDGGETRYPLLLHLEGGEAVEFGLMDRALDNLVGKTVAPLVVAFVPRQDYRESGSGLAQFEQALARELVALLDERYRTVAEPSARAVMGGFTKGAAAIYLALGSPGVFGSAAVQSMRLAGGMEDDLIARLETIDNPDLRFYVEWSTHDLRFGEDLDCRADSRRLVELLEQHGYKPMTREVVQGITFSDDAPNIYWSGWRQSNDRILEALFPIDQKAR